MQILCLFNQNQTPRSDSANLEPSEAIFCPQILEPRRACARCDMLDDDEDAWSRMQSLDLAINDGNKALRLDPSSHDINTLLCKLQRLNKKQTVMWRGSADVAEGYRQRVLRPVEGELVNGRGAWETADFGAKRYLYYRANRDEWVIAQKLQPDGNLQYAYVTASKTGGLLPVGEATWQMTKGFRGATGGDEWVGAVLKLSVGEAAEAELARQQVGCSTSTRCATDNIYFLVCQSLSA